MLPSEIHTVNVDFVYFIQSHAFLPFLFLLTLHSIVSAKRKLIGEKNLNLAHFMYV